MRFGITKTNPTVLLVAAVATALIYANLSMQPQLTTYLGGSANAHYTQGWPFEHRQLTIQEPDPFVMVGAPKVEFEILHSELDLRFLFLNLVACVALCTSVFFMNGFQRRNSTRILQLDLSSIIIVTTVFAFLAWETSINYQLERDLAGWFPEQWTEPIDIPSCLPNLFTFLPITYSLLCLILAILWLIWLGLSKLTRTLIAA